MQVRVLSPAFEGAIMEETDKPENPLTTEHDGLLLIFERAWHWGERDESPLSEWRGESGRGQAAD